MPIKMAAAMVQFLDVATMKYQLDSIGRDLTPGKRGQGWVWLVVAGLIMGLARPAWAPYRYRQAIDDPMAKQKSRVWDVHGDFAIRGHKVHIGSVRRMVNTGVMRLGGRTDAHKAWRQFISDEDVVALVFTTVCSRDIGTNRAVAQALLESLYAAGFEPDNFMLVGLEDLPDNAEGTRPWHYGWQSAPVDFGSGKDYLPLWLTEVTAIINVPTIMDDNIISLRGALANLSWPMLKSPARFYMNGGDPFIPEVYNLPEIRGKVRLHIGNTLRILYQGGPMITPYLYDHGTLMFSVDPVALDQAGMELVRQARRSMAMPGGVDDGISAGYLETAHALGLGYNDLNFIDYQHIKHDK